MASPAVTSPPTTGCVTQAITLESRVSAGITTSPASATVDSATTCSALAPICTV